MRIKGIGHSSIGILSRIFLCFGFYWLGLMMDSNGKEKPIPLQNNSEQVSRTGKDFRIRVTVKEVRLDAVVLDQKGHQVPDLTADDFEVYQDSLKFGVHENQPPAICPGTLEDICPKPPPPTIPAKPRRL
jgi:hypothetical protein